jgi:type I restriction enzyme, S subunit
MAAMELRRRMERAESLSNAFAVSAVTRPELSGEAKAEAGWRRVRLEEVLTEHLEAVPVEPQASYEVVGVYSFGRGLFERAKLEGTATSYKALHRLHAGQLVLSRLKAWEGAIAIVPDTFDGWFLSPEFPTFDIDTTCIDIEYLRSLVTTEEFWARLGGASRGIGARRERVHAARLLEQEVDLPPLAMQRQVAQKIRSLNDADARRSAARDRIDALLPAALNEAFASLS